MAGFLAIFVLPSDLMCTVARLSAVVLSCFSLKASCSRKRRGGDQVSAMLAVCPSSLLPPRPSQQPAQPLCIGLLCAAPAAGLQAGALLLLTRALQERQKRVVSFQLTCTASRAEWGGATGLTQREQNFLPKDLTYCKG